MFRQYHAQRFRPSLPLIPKKLRGKTVYCPQPNDRGYRYRIGTGAVGTIVYIQDQMSPPGSIRTPPVRRNPWIVEAWENRPYYPCSPNRPKVMFRAGGHTAVVRSLRDGRVRSVADWILLACIDAGFTKP
jgi:hypothetical protein